MKNETKKQEAIDHARRLIEFQKAEFQSSRFRGTDEERQEKLQQTRELEEDLARLPRLPLASALRLQRTALGPWTAGPPAETMVFWLKVRRAGLPFERRDLLTTLLESGKLSSPAAHAFAIEFVDVGVTEGRLTKSDNEKLRKMIAAYERRGPMTAKERAVALTRRLIALQRACVSDEKCFPASPADRHGKLEWLKQALEALERARSPGYPTSSIVGLQADLLTSWNEGPFEQTKGFWKKVREARLPFVRHDPIQSLIKRGKITSHHDHALAIDFVDVGVTEGRLSEKDNLRLRKMIDRYERRASAG